MERNAKERKSKPRSARRSAKRVKVAAGHRVNKTSTSGGTAAPPKTPNLAKQGSTGGGSTSAGSRSASRRSSSTSGGNGNSRKCSRNTEVDNSDTGDDSALRHEVIHELIHQVVTTSIYWTNLLYFLDVFSQLSFSNFTYFGWHHNIFHLSVLNWFHVKYEWQEILKFPNFVLNYEIGKCYDVTQNT